MAQYKANCCGVCDAGLELERRQSARKDVASAANRVGDEDDQYATSAVVVASETSLGMVSIRGADGKSIRRALTEAGFLPGDRVRITKEQNHGE